jgi:glycine/D-amino acid oxidase-like deaminating enzyme
LSHAPEYDAVVVGGGFFGASLAHHLAGERGLRVVLFEQETALLRRASYANQARVHHGYHYPRSVLTAVRCRINFPRFVEDFSDCIFDRFENTYAIARAFSKVTAEQFRTFCERIGAPLSPAPPAVRRLFDANRIEAVFSAREICFDAVRLRDRMIERLDQVPVRVELGAEVRRVRQPSPGVLEVTWLREGEERRTSARAVFNCTYSRLNHLLVGSGLPPLRLKHELTEMPLVDVPAELVGRGLTVMCGPFFSLMPFPTRGLHTLSHVRYTPHCEWNDDPAEPWLDPEIVLRERPRHSHFPHMVRDAARYVPALAACRQVDSLWEVKTVLPRSEVDDSRPVLYRADSGLPGLTSVLGAKIDNIYDIIEVAAGGLGSNAA